MSMIYLLSCTQQKSETKYVITQKYNEHYLKDTIKYVPYDFYTGNNIIIPEKSSYVYFHNKRTICGTDWKITKDEKDGIANTKFKIYK